MMCLLWRILFLTQTCYRMLGVLPSPLWGGVGGGGRAIPAQVAPLSFHRTTPLPTPPPQGGREQTEFVARSGASAFASASPPSRKGGATRASLALERVPFQRDGVGGLARRDRLGREIVDGDRGGDGGGGGAKLLCLGLSDQSLEPRLLDVARVRLVQAIAQRLRRHREREGALEAREALVSEAVEDVDGQPIARGR